MRSARPITAKDRDEWYYRARFEKSEDDAWLQEYGRFPSAWKSPWFTGIVNKNIIAFLCWCRNRGISLGRIAGWLNDHGPSPPQGMAWHKSTVRYLLNRQSSHVEENLAIKRVIRVLKRLRWAQKNQQGGLDQVIALSESTQERARRVWEMHRLLLPAFRRLSAHLVQGQHRHERVADPYPRRATGMQRRAEFGLRYLGTPSLAAKTLRDIVDDAKSSSKQIPAWVAELEQLELTVPEFLGFQLTKFDMRFLGQHKTTEALLRILCKLEGISTRSARRYKSQVVQ